MPDPIQGLTPGMWIGAQSARPACVTLQRIMPGLIEHRISTALLALSMTLSLYACGGDSSGDGGTLPPTEVHFGDTALVVVMNPAVNDGNDRNLPAPGQTRLDVQVDSDDGLSATTDAYVARYHGYGTLAWARRVMHRLVLLRLAYSRSLLKLK